MIDLILEALWESLAKALGIGRIFRSEAFALLVLLFVVHVFAEGVVAWGLTCAIALVGLARFKRSRMTRQLAGVIYLLVAQLQIALIYGILLFTYGYPTLSLFGSPAWMLSAIAIAIFVPGRDAAELTTVEAHHD